MNTPDWQHISTAISQNKICELLPFGPNRTTKLETTKFDICSADRGFATETVIQVTCASSDGAAIRSSFSNTIQVSADIEVGACKIGNLQIKIANEDSNYKFNLNEVDVFFEKWAQLELNRLCGKP
jgi:hypothetical protein